MIEKKSCWRISGSSNYCIKISLASSLPVWWEDWCQGYTFVGQLFILYYKRRKSNSWISVPDNISYFLLVFYPHIQITSKVIFHKNHTAYPQDNC